MPLISIFLSVCAPLLPCHLSAVSLSPEEYREFMQERQERLRAEAEAAAAAEAATGKKK